MLLRMKTMRRRKCCIYAVHGLLSSLTGGNKPCWRSARLGLISLTGESAFSEALSVPPVVVTVCLKPEPQICSYPEEPRRVPPDPRKCLLIWSEWAWWRFCYILQRRLKLRGKMYDWITINNYFKDTGHQRPQLVHKIQASLQSPLYHADTEQREGLTTAWHKSKNTS